MKTVSAPPASGSIKLNVSDGGDKTNSQSDAQSCSDDSSGIKITDVKDPSSFLDAGADTAIVDGKGQNSSSLAPGFGAKKPVAVGLEQISAAHSSSFKDALMGNSGINFQHKLIADCKNLGDRLLPKPGKTPTVLENGERCISFSEQEVEVLAEPLRLTLVGKFSHGTPSMFVLRRNLSKMSFKGVYNVGSLTNKHILISFNLEEDFTKMWEKGLVWIDSFPMRIFKWTTDFNPAVETPLAPVWVSLPGLPCWMFAPRALSEICQMIGKPLRIDEATLNLTKPSGARVLVELNLLSSPPESVTIFHGEKRWKQKILYERMPSFCSYCKKIGHKKEGCHIIKQQQTSVNCSDDMEQGKEVTEQKDSKSKDEEIKEGDARDQPKNFKPLNSEEINEIQEETRGSDREEGEWKQAPKKKKKKRNRKRKEERKNQEGDKLDNQCRSLNQCNVEFNPDETFVSETESEKSDYSTNDEESEETETEKGESEYPSSQEKDDQSSASDGYCSENSPFLTTRNAFYLLSKANRVPRSKLLERAPL